MPFGKIAVVILAAAVAVGLGGFGAALSSWAGSDPVDAVTLADVDGRKDDGDVGLAAADDDDDDGKKKNKDTKVKKRGDGDNTRGNDSESSMRLRGRRFMIAPE